MTNVLLVEDDQDVRSVFVETLETAGFGVTSAENGIAAFATLKDKTFDVIICDYRLPFLDAKGFYDELKEYYPAMAERVVFVTGWAHDEETRKFLQRTRQPFLGKPCSAVELLEAVRRMAEAKPS